MELTIEQTLRPGVAAHRKGRLQVAEHLYRSILQAQPNHPDANHNLGALRIAAGRPLEAVPFFALALETNPTVEQFWLNYADVLIEVSRFEEANQLVADSAQAGVSDEKQSVLREKLWRAL